MKKALWGVGVGVLGVMALYLLARVLMQNAAVPAPPTAVPHSLEATPRPGCRPAAIDLMLLDTTLLNFRRPCHLFYWRPDPDGEFHNYVRLNNFALHGPNYAFEKPENTYRVLIVGDSFPQGIQVQIEEGFPYLLQESLNQNPLPDSIERVEVINLSVDTYGTDRELLFYALLGWRFEPDLVLLSFYIGNDVKDNFIPLNELNEGLTLNRAAFSLDEAGALQLHDMPPINPAEYPDSPVWNWLAQMAASSTPRPEWYLSHTPEIISLEPYQLAYPVDLGLYLPPDEQWTIAWNLTEALITTFQDVVHRQGLPFGVIVIPDRRAVHPEDWDRTQSQYPLVAEASPFAPLERINAFLLAAEIPHLDLSATLRNWTLANPTQRLYYREDGHFNPEGHAVTAQRISLWLQETWLSP